MLLFKAICVAVPIIVGLCVVEMYLRFRWTLPDYWTVAQLECTATEKKLPLTFDPELGFRPVLGDAKYNVDGTRVNRYLSKKPPEACRILFLGDSATARGKMIAALEAVYGEEPFEYWNAGVEALPSTCAAE